MLVRFYIYVAERGVRITADLREYFGVIAEGGGVNTQLYICGSDVY